MTNHLKRDCDLCKEEGMGKNPATVDQKTIFGPWAYLCDKHSEDIGTGPATFLKNVPDV